MESFLDYSYFGLLAILVVFTVTGTRRMSLFLKALEEFEYDSWKGLGSPTLTNNTPQITISVLRYLFQNKFKTSGSSKIVELGSRIRKDLVIYIVVFGLALVVFGSSLAAT